MGDGEAAGDVIRGSLKGVDKFDCELFGTLFARAGGPPASMDPKLMLSCLFGPTGLPFGMYPLAPAALIVTEDGFLLWSP